MSDDIDGLRELVAEVAAAYFSNSHVSPADIPMVIGQIASSLSSISAQGAAAAPEPAAAEAPAAPKLTRGQIQKSITPDHLVSFEDSRPYRTLRRHLSSRGLTPEQYRAKWDLPSDYPMVAPSYSEARSQMAKSLGLGRKPGTPAPTRGRKKP
jgi:predicted transcriptional regulator